MVVDGASFALIKRTTIAPYDLFKQVVVVEKAGAQARLNKQALTFRREIVKR